MIALALALAAAAVAQPIPYSHKQHITLGLKCGDCHTMPEPGEMMTFPAAAKCMTCHGAVKTDSPHIRKLAGYLKEQRDVPWVRVYQIPSYVSFSHKTHLDAGSKCETCHGPVAQRDVIEKETDISMGGCMNCHRANKASLDCSYCHEPR